MNQEILNNIKKVLYKENPDAKFCYITKSGVLYSTEVNNMAIMFVIPLNDLGDAKFSPKMEAKLLIRYINTINPITDN